MCSSEERSICLEEVWDALVCRWGVFPEDKALLHEAVIRSNTLRSMLLKQNCALVTDQRTLTRFVEHTCTPGTVLRTLEDLITDGQLSQACAVRIRACVGQRIDPSGQWRRIRRG